MRANKTKAKLQNGEMVFGAAVGFDSPDTVELLGALGFDYVTFDLEHEVFDERAILHAIRAAENYDITPILRVANDPDLILRLLDAGAQGIHVPQINTVEQAKRVVDACRFHPQGNRTFYAVTRSGNYGIGYTEEEYAEVSNRETLVILQVEELEGVNNLDDILAVPHVDAFQVGPKDLWQSMGMPDRSKVWEVVDDVITRAVQAGRWASMYAWIDTNMDDQIAHYQQLGVNLVTISARDLVVLGTKAYLTPWHQAAGRVRS